MKSIQFAKVVLDFCREIGRPLKPRPVAAADPVMWNVLAFKANESGADMAAALTILWNNGSHFPSEVFGSYPVEKSEPGLALPLTEPNFPPPDPRVANWARGPN